MRNILNSDSVYGTMEGGNVNVRGFQRSSVYSLDKDRSLEFGAKIGSQTRDLCVCVVCLQSPLPLNVDKSEDFHPRSHGSTTMNVNFLP